MNPVVEVRGLRFKYGGEPLLDGIDFAVAPEDFIAVTGSNGAGKSTLLKLLLGELASSEGGIYLFGEEISRFRYWPRIGYVPQSGPASNMAFPATVEEIVCSSLYSSIGPFRPVRKIHREKARQALVLVGMESFIYRMITELSGGQFQRVMIARALAADCRMLLLDEPTSGIDAESTDMLYKLLQKLNRAGMTILMVTHDMARAAEYVSRILYLEEGALMELDREQLENAANNRRKYPWIG